ncbi:MAG: DoxX family protein [Phycisphaerales bacterium]|nr:DoxX family protein [Phycisphaerales bacterium]
MARRDRIALALPPLLLRLGLGIMFIMAGLGKVAGTMPARAEQAAILANMGVDIKPAAGDTTPAPPPAPAQSPAEGDGAVANPGAEAMPADGFKEPSDAAGGCRTYTGTDFPENVDVRMVYHLALGIHTAANPPIDAKGNFPPSIWPKDMASGSWPLWIAWTVAIIELLGGALVLIGLTTRFWAAAIAGVMIGAMWLTQFGPAIQAGDTVLRFFPSHRILDTAAWQTLLLQFVLLMMACALMLSRPGALAIDNALFGRRSGDLDEDGDDDE